MSETRIFKYTVNPSGPTMIPIGANILAAGYLRGGLIVVWAVVIPTATPWRRKLVLVETGDPPPEDHRFVATLISPSGYVSHLFDGGDE